ncbi:class A beta-lactamase-related serine hydrolase [Staphylococcus simulans]|uniref:serine hydrolase domain-containing protein n=1 Tax=Staphylococcus simulans TaxID=1286 RepID=UPI000E682CC4|nr:serine hydrolase domain-containing protein [Staphylococcus simulans]RIN74020.1 class A beta-lactamase-related serine hydrolase [Staphylococcus simulans]
MNRKIRNGMIFVIVVTLLVGVFSFYLNWKHHQSYTQHQLPKINETAQSKEKADYHTVMKDNAVDPKIDAYLKGKGFNGTITIFHKGQIIMDKAYGYQNFEENKKNTPNSMYLIGSSQKFTTGLLLKKLENEGKLNINDPLDKYLPWFKTEQPLYLKDLMLHRSGLKKFTGSNTAHSNEDVARELQRAGIQPGKYHKHQYNDGNYIILSDVIQKVTHKPFDQYFDETLKNPNQLYRTAFYNETEYQSFMAQGYNAEKQPTTLKFMDHYYGAGNLFMSTRDMAKLITNLQENKILSPKDTQGLLYEVHTSNYNEPYRYGFYSYDNGNRVNGMFFGHQMTSYFNKDYIVVMGTNYQYPKYVNEHYMKDIFVKQLHQPDPTKKTQRHLI